MKKTFLTAVIFLATATVANAQLIFSKTGCDLGFVPKSLTVSEKTVPYMVVGYEYANINILDDNFNTVKTLNLNCPKYKSVTFTETATVELTGAKLNLPLTGLQYSGSRYYYYDNASGTTIYPTATTLTEMITVLNEHSYDADFKEFQIDGMVACYDANGYDFYQSSIFGKKYPSKIYAIGEDNFIYYYYISGYYTPTFDESSAQWTNRKELSSYEYGGKPVYCEFVDYDRNGVVTEERDAITQNFFNSDDKWEYIVEIISDPVTTYSYSDNPQMNANGTTTITRTGKTTCHVIGFKVLSEDGTVLFEVNHGENFAADKGFDVNLVIVNGKKYLIESSYGYISTEQKYESQTVVYLIDENTSSLSLIQSSTRSGNFKAVPANGILELQLADEFTNSDLILTGVAGQQVGRTHIPAGQQNASINVSGLPQGVYNATISKGNKTIGTQKFLIK